MNETILNFIINKLSLLFSYAYELKMPMKKAYFFYHHFILKLLLDDLYQAKSEMSEIQLNKKFFPNKIWVMWWQGLDNAPQLVLNNIKRLYSIFGENNVIVITQNNFEKYTKIQSFLYDKTKKGEITFALWSDIIRYNLLFNNGGLWVDSTVILANNVKEYLESLKETSFVSLCNKQDDCRYISNNKWSGWFIGGSRDYKLFRFIVSFFDVYFKNHNKQIDYFLVDDAVYYFYMQNKQFRRTISEQSLDWNPYLFANNYKSKDSVKLIHLFNTMRKYSIQKFSYKIKYNTSKESLFNLLNSKN